MSTAVLSNAFSPNEARPFSVENVMDVNYNTRIIRMSLPTGTRASLPIASCVLVSIKGPTGETVTRPYTPVSSDEDLKYVDLIVKRYATGNASRALCDLKKGEVVSILGPLPKIEYKANQYEQIGMLAGGTGITPMLQILRRALKDKEDKTRFVLLFSNVSEKDILQKDELELFKKKHSDRFEIHHVVSQAPEGWKGHVGHLNADVLRQRMPPPKDKNIVFVCGPPGYMQYLCGEKPSVIEQGPVTGLLGKLEYGNEHVFKF